uniref:Uncharacterized protein n=1 Tax=Timema monikensis TaxID=170555 RepID=A0A7R9HWC6_9NEOP|nr:unnamed protein product [Timema monikensis]
MNLSYTSSCREGRITNSEEMCAFEGVYQATFPSRSFLEEKGVELVRSCINEDYSNVIVGVCATQPNVLGEIMNCVIINLIPTLVPSPPDVETLRVYVTLPLYREFDNPKHYKVLQNPFGSAVLNLKTEAARVLGESL